MSAPGSTARTSETKRKIESKPMVENKAEIEKKGKSAKIWILAGSLLVALSAGVIAFMTLPSCKGARTALWNMALRPEVEQKVKAMMPLEPFLVNLADSDDVRFVKTTFQLGLAEEPEESATKAATVAAIRDSIISLLSSKKAEQILSPQGKESLRQEIRTRINELSPETKVLEVYIVDFVVQL